MCRFARFRTIKHTVISRTRPVLLALEARTVPTAYTWIGGGHVDAVNISGDPAAWSNQLNWLPQTGVPGLGDTVYFSHVVNFQLYDPNNPTQPAMYTSAFVAEPVVDFATGVAGLGFDPSWGDNWGPGSTGSLVVAKDLTVSNSMTWLGGRISIFGNAVLLNNGIMTLSSANNVRLSGGTFINAGTVKQTGAGGLKIESNGSFTNQAGAVYDISADSNVFTDFSGGTFTSSGLIRKSGGIGSSYFSTAFVNSGAIDVQSGTLAIATNNGISTGGTFTVAFGATLDLTGGVNAVHYQGNYTGSGTGRIVVNSGVLNPQSATFDFPPGLFHWSGGQISGSLTNRGSMILDNTQQASLRGGSIVNLGIFTVTGTGTLGVYDGALFDNRPCGVFDFQTSSYVGSDFSGGSFSNGGVLRHSTTGTTGLGLTFTQLATGVIDIQSGALQLSSSLPLGGVIQGSGALNTSLSNSSGSVRPGNSPGTLTINGNYSQNGTGQLRLELNGTSTGQFDKLAVNGSVSLDGPLMASVGYIGKAGDNFVVLANDGNDTIDGTFTGLAEAATFNANGATLAISYKGGDGNDVTLNVVSILATASPKVTNVQINDGAAQRSSVTSLKVSFDQHVALPADAGAAFQLTRQSDSASVNLAGAVDDNGSGTVVSLTFTSCTAQSSSLADGRYTLRVLAAQVGSAGGSLDGDGNGTGGDDFTLVGSPANGLFRLLGDSNGDGTLAANDFIQFRLAYGTSNPIFDFDNDGTVGPNDFIQFRLRFGGSI